MNCYLHIPFCRRKCGYCAFYSLPSPRADEIAAYLDHLEQTLPELPEPPETIYLGGGTPTLLTERELERLFSLLRKRWRPDARCEITVEANPETLTGGKIALIRDFATRLSLGVQSFAPVLRKTLGRDCSQHALDQSLQLVRDASFPHWNCDLIYAVPGETMTQWENDLRQAAETGADHLSCYSLTAEEGARLAPRWKLDDDFSAACWQTAGVLLGEHGIQRYEISNYARAGAECRHNRNVWRGGLLKGFGPAAASFDGAVRTKSPDSLSAWLAGTAPERDEIPRAARLDEIFAVQLRTAEGWTPESWRAVPHADEWEARLAKIEAILPEIPPEWIAFSPERITLNDSGLLFWDTIAELIL